MFRSRFWPAVKVELPTLGLRPNMGRCFASVGPHCTSGKTDTIPGQG